MATKPPTRIPLGDIESKSERVPPGHYHARIISNPLKPNKAKDGYYFNPDFQILSEGPAKNRHIWDIWPLKATALFKLKAGLVACGVDGNSEIDVDEVPSLTEGMVVDIIVTEGEEYNGEPQSKVSRVKPSTMPSLGDLAEDEEEDEDEDAEGEDEPYTKEELKEFDLADLKEIAEELGVTVKRGAKKVTLITAILEAQEAADEDEDEEDEDDEEVEESEEEEEDEEDDDLFEEPAPKKAAAKKRVRR